MNITHNTTFAFAYFIVVGHIFAFNRVLYRTLLQYVCPSLFLHFTYVTPYLKKNNVTAQFLIYLIKGNYPSRARTRKDRICSETV